MASAGKRKATSLDTLPPICGGALVTSVVMYPVDVVRALCMANPGTGAGAALSGFLEAHGVMGFVKQGLVAEVTRASISRAIKFFMQPIVHRSLYGKPETQGTPVSKGLAGALGTVPEVFAISPLENIKLAAQLDKEGKFSGSADIAKHILKTRGFGGLMIGYAGMQVRQFLWTGGFFLTLDLYKGAFGGVVSNKLAQDVLSGFAAGATGTALNCWTDVCRSIVQKNALRAMRLPLPYAGLLFALNGPLACRGVRRPSESEVLGTSTADWETDGPPAPRSSVRQQNQTLISSRFGQYPEQEARQLYRELRKMGLNPKIVSAEVGEDYGLTTVSLIEASKAMIVMASDNYGELSSPYCTFYELKYAYEHGIAILPVQLAAAYPPQPPGDPRGAELCKWVLGRSRKRLDWSNQRWDAKRAARELKSGILEAYKAEARDLPRLCSSCRESAEAESAPEAPP